ncbi:MAG: response regulator [Nocardioides sp.]
MALEGLDVELVECADGALALLEVGRRQADIVVLTARLPVLDAAAFVATLSQVGRIPVLLGVGEGDGDLAARALTAGASRVLPRPYDPGQVRQAVTAAEPSSSTRSPTQSPLMAGASRCRPVSWKC